MPNIDLNKFKEQGKVGEIKEYTYSKLDVKDTQYFFKNEEVVFDIIDMDFDGKGPGMEILMSFLGEDFKMRVDYIPKERFDSIDVPKYLIDLLEENIGCLECKTKFLDTICRDEEDDDLDLDEEI